jgi:hypothetical protein
VPAFTVPFGSHERSSRKERRRRIARRYQGKTPRRLGPRWLQTQPRREENRLLRLSWSSVVKNGTGEKGVRVKKHQATFVRAVPSKPPPPPRVRIAAGARGSGFTAAFAS